MALMQYHEVLCTHSDPDHPMSKVLQLARSHNRTNPLVIARIFAIVTSRMRAAPQGIREETVTHPIASVNDSLSPLEDPEKPYAPFGTFVSNEEASPEDERIVELIRAALAPHHPVLPHGTFFPICLPSAESFCLQ